jgi:hypothetical protein
VQTRTEQLCGSAFCKAAGITPCTAIAITDPERCLFLLHTLSVKLKSKKRMDK